MKLTLDQQIAFVERQLSKIRVELSAMHLHDQGRLEEMLEVLDSMASILTTLRCVKQGGWLP